MSPQKKYIYGASACVHNQIATAEDDDKFSKELLKKANIIGVVVSDNPETSNYYRLHDIIRLFLKGGVRRVRLELQNPLAENLVTSLPEVASFISKARYVFLFDALIQVSGLPFCLVPEPESFIVNDGCKKDFVKLEKCSDCRYNQQCDGILKGYLKNLDQTLIKPQPLPKEVMVEVTPKCNFRCSFCFNYNSFARRNRQIRDLSAQKIKKIINAVSKAGVPIIRFTGGEPFLRSDILEIIKYAKKKNLQVRLNTNGFLIKNFSLAKELASLLDYALFSMHTYNAKKDELITGVSGSFNKKIRAIRWLKKAGVKTIRVSTIANLDNINNLDKFYTILGELGVDKWATNRMIPIPGTKDIWGKKELNLLVDKLTNIRQDVIKKRLPIKIHIVNGVPLCALDPIRMNAVCSGARSVDGHERFVIDPRGFAKPIYYIEKNIGSAEDILGCWNHSFMQSLRSYRHLPTECQNCLLVEKCKGGNRYCAYRYTSSWRGADPLMNFRNIKKVLNEPKEK